ncbi:MAG TPA: hypothetical protein VI636_22930, partial [Candidatus Angelobacter sp.]
MTQQKDPSERSLVHKKDLHHYRPAASGVPDSLARTGSKSTNQLLKIAPCRRPFSVTPGFQSSDPGGCDA